MRGIKLPRRLTSGGLGDLSGRRLHSRRSLKQASDSETRRRVAACVGVEASGKRDSKPRMPWLHPAPMLETEKPAKR